MKKSNLRTLALCLCAFSVNGFAHNIQLHHPLPAVQIAEQGEMVLAQNHIQYQPWDSATLPGKVRVIHHFAGRKSVKEKNDPLMHAIGQAALNPEHYQTTSIINMDDVIFGTGGFVKSKAESGKKSHAHTKVILDKKGAVKTAWQLNEKESLIVVLDKKGIVHFVQEGALDQNQIQHVLDLLRQLSQ